MQPNFQIGQKVYARPLYARSSVPATITGMTRSLGNGWQYELSAFDENYSFPEWVSERSLMQITANKKEGQQ